MPWTGRRQHMAPALVLQRLIRQRLRPRRWSNPALIPQAARQLLPEPSHTAARAAAAKATAAAAEPPAPAEVPAVVLRQASREVAPAVVQQRPAN
mmetsp:Transcript_10626/g.20589  ORF Transcript_10626/g.20589 Transcript_10626/m.20589 type:complete len:95 (+) Transcript_10626:1223-1507(+)